MTQAIEEGEGVGFDQGMSAAFDHSQSCQCIFGQQAFVAEADELVGQVFLLQTDVFWP